MEKKITTLVLVHQGEKVLLGMKKRGFGQGRWNGFGGKLHEGETIEQAAKRETFEEAGVQVGELEKFGVMDFYWKNKPEFCVEVNVFKVRIFAGIPTESEEMKPQWFDLKEIPYKEMWQDDTYWMPLFLNDKKFKGKFIFDDSDNILEKELNEVKEI
jgi:8-oxo-dGTP diphosphatase/2-hydroxy-dATP diphosphatase